jgi:hypothetical protein
MKKYAVFFLGGGGGRIVSYLIQCVIDPKHLKEALNGFPTSLMKNSGYWKAHETIPANVGLVCNGYMPWNCVDKERAKKLIDATFDSLLQKNDSVYHAMHLRVRVYEGHGDFKEETDILFDREKQIFLQTPPEYVRLSLAKKTNTVLPLVMDDYINNQIESRGLPIFRFQTLWNKEGTYIDELAKVLKRKLTNEQIEACHQLIDRYMDVTPQVIHDFFEEKYGS